MNNKLQPALIGGVVLGLLSSIPFVNFVNLCCCAWAIAGGALASYLYINRSPVRATAGDGALLGATSGVIGTIVSWFVGIPLSLIVGDSFNLMIVKLVERIDPRQAELVRQQIEIAESQPFIERLPALLIGMVTGIVLYTIFSTIGGLLGVALFESRKQEAPAIPPPPPPPPPGYGGQPY